MWELLDFVDVEKGTVRPLVGLRNLVAAVASVSFSLVQQGGTTMLATPRRFDRRDFLRGTCKAGLAVTLAAMLHPPTVALAHTQDARFSQEVENALSPEVFELLKSGLGALWVAGISLNAFTHALNFANMTPPMLQYFRRAGGEWRTLYEARGVWETIPEQIRAGGQQEISRFLSNKDWSHKIPRSYTDSRTAHASNGIFENSILNRTRGRQPMSAAEIEAARAVIRSDMMYAVVRMTLGAMVKGALLGVLIAGTLTCLECGLQYAEGKMTWQQMTMNVIRASAVAGALSFMIVGIVIGFSLIFPSLIPMMAGVFFVLQIAGLVFLVQHLVNLGKDYWAYFKDAGLLDEVSNILEETEEFMQNTIKETRRNTSTKMQEWIQGLANWVGWERAWSIVKGFNDRLGADRAWVWFASQTEFVKDYTTELLAPVGVWGNTTSSKISLPKIDLPDVDLPKIDIATYEMKETIANMINVEFNDALKTSKQLRGQLEDYMAEVAAG